MFDGSSTTEIMCSKSISCHKLQNYIDCIEMAGV